MPESCVHFVLSHDVYDKAEIVQAGEAYAAYLDCNIVSTSADVTEIAVCVLPPNSTTDPIIDEFLNHALDLSIRRKLARG
jgi:hypothetical protein